MKNIYHKYVQINYSEYAKETTLHIITSDVHVRQKKEFNENKMFHLFVFGKR